MSHFIRYVTNAANDAGHKDKLKLGRRYLHSGLVDFMEMTYTSEIAAGDHLNIHVWETDGKHLFSEIDVDNKVAFKFKLKYNDG